MTGAALRMQSDARLTELARTGSTEAFGAIVDRYRDPLLRYSSQRLRCDQAEDIVQQTFERAFSAINGDNPPRELKAWLYRVAHNATMDHFRSGTSGEQSLDHALDTSGSACTIEPRQQFNDTITELARLPERQRRALVASALEDRGNDEIGAELGLSANGTAQLIFRARTALRNAVGALIPLPVLRMLTAKKVAGSLTAVSQSALAAAAGSIIVAAMMVPVASETVGRDSVPQAASPNSPGVRPGGDYTHRASIGAPVGDAKPGSSVATDPGLYPKSQNGASTMRDADPLVPGVQPVLLSTAIGPAAAFRSADAPQFTGRAAVVAARAGVIKQRAGVIEQRRDVTAARSTVRDTRQTVRSARSGVRDQRQALAQLHSEPNASKQDLATARQQLASARARVQQQQRAVVQRQKVVVREQRDVASGQRKVVNEQKHVQQMQHKAVAERKAAHRENVSTPTSTSGGNGSGQRQAAQQQRQAAQQQRQAAQQQRQAAQQQAQAQRQAAQQQRQAQRKTTQAPQ